MIKMPTQPARVAVAEQPASEMPVAVAMGTSGAKGAEITFADGRQLLAGWQVQALGGAEVAMDAEFLAACAQIPFADFEHGVLRVRIGERAAMTSAAYVSGFGVNVVQDHFKQLNRLKRGLR